MLTQKDQKSIRSKLDNIYKILLSKKDIDYFENEIVQIIKYFNKKNPKKKKKTHKLNKYLSNQKINFSKVGFPNFWPLDAKIQVF